MKTLLVRTDEWFRRRLRSLIWKQQKRIRTKLRDLIKLGIQRPKAWDLRTPGKATGALPITQS